VSVDAKDLERLERLSNSLVRTIDALKKAPTWPRSLRAA